MKEGNSNKRVLILITILILFGFIFILVKFGLPFINKTPVDVGIEIVELDFESKNLTGDYLILSNALYQKSLDTAKETIQYTDFYNEGKISIDEFRNVITRNNKKLTYYYLLSLQIESPETTKESDSKVSYDFYLMRRASEELLKFLKDGSSLRTEVSRDLFNQAIEREDMINTALATDIAKYDIDPNGVAIDPSIWEGEYQFIAQVPDMVIFKDLNSTEMNEYSYYLEKVNDSFMLVSWEVQKMYLKKFDYQNKLISSNELSSDISKSTYIINGVYEELKIMNSPVGLENLEEDTNKTLQLYYDAVLEINKFNMTNDTQCFENAQILIDQADLIAGRIGEFIYSVRYQYGF